MRLLLGQNLSRRLVALLDDPSPGRCMSRLWNLDAASDMAIWNFARENGYAIVSKDADFHHLSFLHGAPPKTIWIRLGNCSTGRIADCLTGSEETVRRFLADPEAALLVLER